MRLGLATGETGAETMTRTDGAPSRLRKGATVLDELQVRLRRDEARVKLAGPLPGFDLLASFDFTPPTYDTMGADGKPTVKKGDEQIPEQIKALHAQKVVVTGFMLPIKMEGLVKAEGLLMSEHLSQYITAFVGVP